MLYALGSTPPVVMAETGHTAPQLALSIYAKVMSRDEGQVEALRALVHGSDWAAIGQQEHSEVVEGRAPDAPENERPGISGVCASGASRDRTGDLLLAKQALSHLSYGPFAPRV